MIKAIFIDMDDTLIVNQSLYHAARMQLVGYLKHYGITRDEVMTHNMAVNEELYKTYGYSRTRFPLSFEMTLKHFIPNADEAMVREVRELAESVFTTVADLKPGTKEAIDDLTSRFPVYIVTQGDTSVQQFRVSHLPFKDQLAGVFIVDKKSKETFEALGARLGLQPGEAIMVGDSIKSDVVTSIAAGFKGGWIEAHNWTQIEAASLPPGAFRFSSLLEFARHLNDDGTIDTPKPHRAPAPRPTPPKL